jgi:leucyl-tRNA synthetase
VYYVNGFVIDAVYLPIVLPEVESIYQQKMGLPPLGNAEVWAWDTATKVVNTGLVDHKTVFL